MKLLACVGYETNNKRFDYGGELDPDADPGTF